MGVMRTAALFQVPAWVPDVALRSREAARTSRLPGADSPCRGEFPSGRKHPGQGGAFFLPRAGGYSQHHPRATPLPTDRLACSAGSDRHYLTPQALAGPDRTP